MQLIACSAEHGHQSSSIKHEMTSPKTLELQLFDGSLPEAENWKIIHPTRWNNRPLSCAFQDHSRLSDGKDSVHTSPQQERRTWRQMRRTSQSKRDGDFIKWRFVVLQRRRRGGTEREERQRWMMEIEKENYYFFSPHTSAPQTSGHTTTITAQHPQNLPVAANTRKHAGSKHSHT